MKKTNHGVNIIITIFVMFLLLCSTIGNANVLTKNKNDNNKTVAEASLSGSSIYAPEWHTGNYWTYDMTFVFDAVDEHDGNKLHIDGGIDDMTTTVVGHEELDGEEVYVFDVQGDFDGDVSLLDIFDLGDLSADFSGTAYQTSNSLAPKIFDFVIDGELDVPIIGTVDFYFTMYMVFDPRFDYLNFPIDPEDDGWSVNIQNAAMDAYIEIDYMGPISYSTDYHSAINFNDYLITKGIKTVKVPAGNFECVELSGSWGEPSELYYSPEVGFLAKIEEGFDWGSKNKIEAEFHMELVDTNYITGNKPPSPPDQPVGPTEGDINEEYSFDSITRDGQNDRVYYWFDWGDGKNSGWLGPYSSNQKVTAEHRWFQRGLYNIMVKAKDDTGIESEWSEPLTIDIGGDDPCLTLLMHRISNSNKDEIDYHLYDAQAWKPEWYYEVKANSDGFISSATYHNTDNGNYRNNADKWKSQYTWNPDKEHTFLVKSRQVKISIKLMDFDDPTWEGGDDLADISGCNHPDNYGYGDDTPDKRGAMFYSFYDMGSTEDFPLSQYSSNYKDYSDYWEESNGYYLIAGDDKPDKSTDYENWPTGIENDAEVQFALYDNYDLPEASASIVNLPLNLRPGDSLDFSGCVLNGAADYTWQWDFDDGSTSNKQNPSHSFSSPGEYNVQLTLTDALEQTSTDSITITVYENVAPYELKITGPDSGDANEQYSYKFRAVDFEQDELSYKIDWGDGSDTGWKDAVESGTQISLNHKWSDGKSYTISFKAKDTYGSITEKKLTVEIEKVRSRYIVENFHFLKIFELIGFKFSKI